MFNIVHGPFQINNDLSVQVKALHPNKKPVLVLPVAQKLSKEQTAVLNAVLSGKNVFFTGSAGNLFIHSHICFIQSSSISWRLEHHCSWFYFRYRKVLLAQKDYRVLASKKHVCNSEHRCCCLSHRRDYIAQFCRLENIYKFTIN